MTTISPILGLDTRVLADLRGPMGSWLELLAPRAGCAEPEVDRGVVRIQLSGPMGMMSWMGCNTQELGARIRAAADNPAVRTIVLDVNSPGGEIAGMSDLVGAVRYARQSGKRVHAIAHDMMASSAYWACCLADELVCTSTARVGSVGVLMSALDNSKMFEAEGLRMVVAKTGLLKATGVPGVPISPEQEQEMLAVARAAFALMSADVAEGRKMKPEAIAALEGGVFLGQAAVAAGLADRVVEFDSYLEKLKNHAPAAAHGPGVVVTTSGRLFGETHMSDQKIIASVDEARQMLSAEAFTQLQGLALEAALAAGAVVRPGKADAPAEFPALKAEFGDIGFAAECLDKGLTLAAARSAWNGRQKDTIATLQAKVTSLETELAQVKSLPGGREPVNTGPSAKAAPGASGGGAVGEVKTFEDAVKLELAGVDPSVAGQAAIAKAAFSAQKKHPRLHDDWRSRGCPAVV